MDLIDQHDEVELEERVGALTLSVFSHSGFQVYFSVKTWSVCSDLYRAIRGKKIQLLEFISMVGSCVIFFIAFEMPQDPLDPFSAEVKELSFMDLHQCTSF